MKKVTKIFMDIKKEQDWLSSQKGWKLIYTNGMSFTFEECYCEFYYEFVFFDKNSNELDSIRRQIIDQNIEFVCNTSTWALFRKDASKGEIHVFPDNYMKYKSLMKKYSSYMSLGACYLCLGSSQIALSTTINSFFGLPSVLFYMCSIIFYMYSSYFKKYASGYDDGTYAARLKRKE